MTAPPLPPDFPVCEALEAPSPTCQAAIGEESCGHCIYFMSGRQIFVGEQKGHLLNNKPWSDVDAESLLLPSFESWAPLAAYLRADIAQRVGH